MTIKNDSVGGAYLVSVRTAAAKTVEIHQMGRADGMMTMKLVDGVPIPAHGKVALEPDGYHLMLIGLKKPLQPGARIKLTLHFRGGKTLALVAPVQTQADADQEPAR